MTRPVGLVIVAPGTNRDRDAAWALEMAGAEARIVAIADLAADPALMAGARLAVIAGGFAHADALGAGRLFARELRRSLADQLDAFVAAGKPVIGICNGFQSLVRLGLLPGAGLTAALGHNAGGQFLCRWVELEPTSPRCVWTAGSTEPIECPIAHGEGRFVVTDDTLTALRAGDQIALRYADNPNGSVGDVAGVCDPSGVVLGLMPHPENHVLSEQHPVARRRGPSRLGLRLFQSGVAHARSL